MAHSRETWGSEKLNLFFWKVYPAEKGCQTQTLTERPQCPQAIKKERRKTSAIREQLFSGILIRELSPPVSSNVNCFTNAKCHSSVIQVKYPTNEARHISFCCWEFGGSQGSDDGRTRRRMTANTHQKRHDQSSSLTLP